MARIMIVDDSPTDVLNLKTMLVKAGHIVTEAASGELAISRIRLRGGVYGLGPDRTQLVFSLDDGLEVDGTEHPAWTALCSPRGEEAVLSSAKETEALVIELPRSGRRA